MNTSIPGPMDRGKWLLALSIWLLVVFAFGALSAGSHKLWTPVTTGNRGDQCEALNFHDSSSKTGKVLEVQNTWSNAAYLLAGILVLLCSRKPLGTVLGVQLCVLAVLSGLYHATLQDDTSNTFDSQMLDVAGIYLVLWGMLAYGAFCCFFGGRLEEAVIRAQWKYGDALLVALQVAISAVVSVSAFAMAANRKNVAIFGSTTLTFTLVALLIVMCGWQMSRVRFNWCRALPIWQLFWPPREEHSDTFVVRWYFWGFMILGGGGILFRLNDGLNGSDPKPFCCPQGMLHAVQAHALWHVLGGAALLLGYDFFAWISRSAGWADYNVTGVTDPALSPSNYRDTAILSGVLAVGFLVITLFTPGSLVDQPDTNLPTAWAITGLFAAIAITLAVLKLAGVGETAGGTK